MLRKIVYGIAIPQKLTVFDAIFAFQNSANTQTFSQGRVITATSGSGQSATFQAAPSAYDQERVVAQCERFFAILTNALAGLVGIQDDGQASSSAAIFTAMMNDDDMQAVTRRGQDNTLLGWPYAQTSA